MTSDEPIRHAGAVFARTLLRTCEVTMVERARDVQRLCVNYPLLTCPTYPTTKNSLGYEEDPTSRNAPREAVTVDGGSIFSAAPPTEPDGLALRRLHEAATPSPWHIEEHWDAVLEETSPIVCGPEPRGVPRQGLAEVLSDNAAADAEFIIAARNAVPSLLDRLAAVERERDGQRARADHNAAAVNTNADMIVELRAENERISAAWAEVRAAVARAMARPQPEIGGDDCGDLLPGDEALPLAGNLDPDPVDVGEWPSGSLPVEPAKRTACRGFAWVGQSFAHCDECGLPFWEHTHNRDFDRSKGPFALDGEVLVPITAEQAEACRRKWGPVSGAAPEETR